LYGTKSAGRNELVDTNGLVLVFGVGGGFGQVLGPGDGHVHAELALVAVSSKDIAKINLFIFFISSVENCGKPGC
jgi:hypothetical protein